MCWSEDTRPQPQHRNTRLISAPLERVVIVDVEVTPTRISKKVDASETMLERTKEGADAIRAKQTP